MNSIILTITQLGATEMTADVVRTPTHAAGMVRTRIPEVGFAAERTRVHVEEARGRPPRVTPRVLFHVPLQSLVIPQQGRVGALVY